MEAVRGRFLKGHLLVDHILDFAYFSFFQRGVYFSVQWSCARPHVWAWQKEVPSPLPVNLLNSCTRWCPYLSFTCATKCRLVRLEPADRDNDGTSLGIREGGRWDVPTCKLQALFSCVEAISNLTGINGLFIPVKQAVYPVSPTLNGINGFTSTWQSSRICPELQRV